ncbi:Protein of unknown function DUF2921 [Dillenia turbinata]|uniref:RING-type E3 ubiquitin transferase n=1 Tax=Dillenia turbinata TaxID=194707 RepID=A0AAN8VJ31_9MAGN
MVTNRTSCSPPIHKSRVSSMPTKNPLNTHLHILVISLILNISGSVSLSYPPHCNKLVPASTPTAAQIKIDQFLQLQNAFYTGGYQILGNSSDSSKNSVTFLVQHINTTSNHDVYSVKANLYLKRSILVPETTSPRRGLLRQFRYRQPHFPVRRRGMTLVLNGFWSTFSGKLCMIGSGKGFAPDSILDLNVVVKLNYANGSSILKSLVNGVVESLDEIGTSSYFEPVHILGVTQLNYEYTFVMNENWDVGIGGNDDLVGWSLSLEKDRDLCSMLSKIYGGYELTYESDCGNGECNPFGEKFDFVPNFLSFTSIQCVDEKRLQLLVNLFSSVDNVFVRDLAPNATFVAEGKWDEKRNRFLFVACRILYSMDSLSDSSIGDCFIRFSLRFRGFLTLRDRSVVVGKIWSNQTVNGSVYYGNRWFSNARNKLFGLSGLKYKYSEIDTVTKTCSTRRTSKHKGKTYPNGHSSDMRFRILVGNSKEEKRWGSATPLFIGNQFYSPFALAENTSSDSLLNVSYWISFTAQPSFMSGGAVSHLDSVEISAEGIYDAKAGVLCMIGCKHLRSIQMMLTQNNSLDCEISINAQLSPLDAKVGGTTIRGTIESMRQISDPLYFQRLEFASRTIYSEQARNSIWRMDLEIVMVLISNTLACIFIGLQLLHVKSHPDVLPFISIVMLIVLTLGHMIPLLLNFDAMFKPNPEKQKILFGSGGWLEVNEVIVRVVTMVAFLLQFRLLQLAFSARSADGDQKISVSEKKVFGLSFSLYIAGGLIAWLVYGFKHSYKKPFLAPRLVSYQTLQQQSLWVDLKSYGGLILDGFLLPQMMFNIFCDSREKSLATSFYVGTSVVRILPHAYDLYRAHASTLPLNLFYIYANPRTDFFSTAWDVIIPCCSLLFVALITLQQRYGGRCIVPKRFRESSIYEKVPVVSNEEL